MKELGKTKGMRMAKWANEKGKASERKKRMRRKQGARVGCN